MTERRCQGPRPSTEGAREPAPSPGRVPPLPPGLSRPSGPAAAGPAAGNGGRAPLGGTAATPGMAGSGPCRAEGERRVRESVLGRKFLKG